MKTLILGLGLMALFVGCVKVKPTYNTPFITCNNDCYVDSFSTIATNYSPNTTITNNCHKFDGVNVKNIITQDVYKAGSLVTISLDAIGISKTCSGSVLFATTNQGLKKEILTFMGYDICTTATSEYFPITVNYTFFATTPGVYNLRFKNVYGADHFVNVNVNP